MFLHEHVYDKLFVSHPHYEECFMFWLTFGPKLLLIVLCMHYFNAAQGLCSGTSMCLF